MLISTCPPGSRVMRLPAGRVVRSATASQVGRSGPAAGVGDRIRQELDLDAHQAPVRRGQAALGDVAAEGVEGEVAPHGRHG